MILSPVKCPKQVFLEPPQPSESVSWKDDQRRARVNVFWRLSNFSYRRLKNVSLKQDAEVEAQGSDLPTGSKMCPS